ncbi:hypothetical protein PsorP6_002418 [Peronosclerospora sorghi]|uniref:Uncharacterized protein n=1 Tax=Peronosclerospora sorghi TaxID=230839 RepID=A0ACC0WTX8_9STRA|nr:hypothetical protein PsorP6_002418 [Peronosclerospora sorghi]
MPTSYVGTYTRKEGHVDGHAKGIYANSFDDRTSVLELLKVTEGAGINPSYVMGTESMLYAVNECNEASALRPGHETGFVTAYKMKQQGELVPLSLHETCGTYACHVALSPQRDFVSVTSLWPTTVAVCHCFRVDLVAADLGTDRVVQYTLDAENQKLVDEEFIFRLPGSGPRHFALSTTLGVAYIIGELDNTVGVHPLDVKTGKVGHEVLQNISTLPPNYAGPAPLASDIHISTNQRFVYAATRFSDTITVYKILADTCLELVEYVSTRGKTPRDILLYKNFLLAVNQDMSSLNVYRADPEPGNSPCLCFGSVTTSTTEFVEETYSRVDCYPPRANFPEPTEELCLAQGFCWKILEKGGIPCAFPAAKTPTAQECANLPKVLRMSCRSPRFASLKVLEDADTCGSVGRCFDDGECFQPMAK